MARRWTEEDYEHTTRQIEDWRAEAHRMWVDADNTIREMEWLRQRLIEQSRTLGCVNRVALWVEE
jgi:hypothetical protein